MSELEGNINSKKTMTRLLPITHSALKKEVHRRYALTEIEPPMGEIVEEWRLAAEAACEKQLGKDPGETTPLPAGNTTSAQWTRHEKHHKMLEEILDSGLAVAVDAVLKNLRAFQMLVQLRKDLHVGRSQPSAIASQVDDVVRAQGSGRKSAGSLP